MFICFVIVMSLGTLALITCAVLITREEIATIQHELNRMREDELFERKKDPINL